MVTLAAVSVSGAQARADLARRSLKQAVVRTRTRGAEHTCTRVGELALALALAALTAALQLGVPESTPRADAWTSWGRESCLSLARGRTASDTLVIDRLAHARCVHSTARARAVPRRARVRCQYTRRPRRSSRSAVSVQCAHLQDPSIVAKAKARGHRHMRRLGACSIPAGAVELTSCAAPSLRLAGPRSSGSREAPAAVSAPPSWRKLEARAPSDARAIQTVRCRWSERHFATIPDGARVCGLCVSACATNDDRACMLRCVGVETARR